MYTLHSERLTLRPYTLQDAPFVLALLNSKAYHQNIGNKQVTTIEQAEQYIQEKVLDNFQKQGLGYLICEVRDTKTSIGICGLLRRDYLPFPDIGFAFLSKYHGKGFAHEAAQALMNDGISRFHLKNVLAIAITDNRPSVKLISKLGMQPLTEYIDPKDGAKCTLFGLAPCDEKLIANIGH